MNHTFNQISKLLLDKYRINCVYDIGANDGSWTAVMSKLFPDAQFFMFEANPSLRKPNLDHGWFNVVLSDLDNREIIFHSTNYHDCNNTGDSYYQEETLFYPGNHQKRRLQTRSLDSFISQSKIPLPEIIKIDTQGSEIDIFLGAKEALNQCKMVLTEAPIIAYNKGAPKLHQYIEVLREYDFIPVGVDQCHIIDNTLTQIDIVFLKKPIKDKLFGGGKFINESLFQRKTNLLGKITHLG